MPFSVPDMLGKVSPTPAPLCTTRKKHISFEKFLIFNFIVRKKRMILGLFESWNKKIYFVIFLPKFEKNSNKNFLSFNFHHIFSFNSILSLLVFKAFNVLQPLSEEKFSFKKKISYLFEYFTLIKNSTSHMLSDENKIVSFHGSFYLFKTLFEIFHLSHQNFLRTICWFTFQRYLVFFLDHDFVLVSSLLEYRWGIAQIQLYQGKN